MVITDKGMRVVDKDEPETTSTESTRNAEPDNRKEKD